MTRNDLIYKVISKAGIADYNAVAFFEIFILKLFKKSKPGQLIQVEGIGYFHSRKGIFKSSPNSNSKSDLENPEEIDLVIFSEFANDIENPDNLFFIIPKDETTHSNEINEYLSFSTGKPVLNLDDPIKDDKIFKLKGSELLRHFNLKADEILASFKVINTDAIKKSIVIQELKEVPKPSGDIKNKDTSSEKIKTEVKPGLKPDFNINREIDEDRMRERKEEDRYQTLPWNFGTRFPLKKVDYKADDSENIIHTHSKPFTGESKSDKSVDEDLIADVEQGKFDSEESSNVESEIESEISEIVGNYQRVKPFSKEAKEKIESKPIQTIKEKKSLKILKPFQDKTKKDSSGYLEVKSKSESYHLRDSSETKKRQWKKEERNESYTRKSSYNQSIYKKKSRVIPFFIILLGIIIVAGAGYLFLEKENIFGENSYSENIVTVTRPPSVNVIERDFSIPVSYPSNYSTAISGIDPSILNDYSEQSEIVSEIESSTDNIKEPEQNITEDHSTKPVKPVNVTTEERIPEEKTETKSVKDPNIFKNGDYYVVQLGTFSNFEKAELEAEKYNNMGYNAFVEIVEVPGQGTKYRVRVGDFTSTEKAQKFKSMHAN